MDIARTLRILVVDDHRDTARFTARMLGMAGYTVEHALSAEDARLMAKSARFDLLISDIGLPGESGLELMRALKSMYGTAGIAVSGSDEVLDHDTTEAGFAARFVKPVDKDKLLRAIEAVTANK
jgi:DNA-binding response OmpR family regulator